MASTSSVPELSNEEAAAMLWTLHAKRLITLEPSQVQWLETFLGELRIRYETACDPELFADKNTKLFAAALLLDMAHNHMLTNEPDTTTVMGLFQMVGQGVTENMYRLSANYQAYYEQIVNASAGAAQQQNAQRHGYATHTPTSTTRQGTRRGRLRNLPAPSSNVLPRYTGNSFASTSSAHAAVYPVQPYFVSQMSSAGTPHINPWHAQPGQPGPSTHQSQR
ncbi:hypothetical protein C8Q78DRAFT_448894 [Trametes maxima]|nr:hypothetical protein C8Q78DRAFT_448894 [Trametes maxima]